MAKLIIAVGHPRTGKTTAGRAWMAEQPGRFYLYELTGRSDQLREVLMHLRAGKDVWLDILPVPSMQRQAERYSDEAIDHGHDVEIREFRTRDIG